MRGFKAGDQGVNSYGARGRITSIDRGAIQVVFSSNGKSWTGSFDDGWFRKFPDMLTKAETRAGERSS